MGNDHGKREYVKNIIRIFLQEIEQKKINNDALSNEERKWIQSKTNLISYVYTQEKHPIYTTDVTLKTGSNTGSTYLTISESSVYKAIAAMERDGEIEYKDNQFQIKHTAAEELEAHPILGIASKLQITPLPVESIALFRVPIRYTDEITHYLNSCFFCDDIYCVSLSGAILCFDIQLPKNGRIVQKSDTVENRIRKALKSFNITAIKNTKDRPGLTEEQVKSAQIRDLLSARDYAYLQQRAYGGKVKVKRKIKRKEN